MDTMLRELAGHIVSGLNLEEIRPEDIRPDAALFGDGADGLGLDSIDALELAVIIDRIYGVKIQGMEQGKAAFASLRSLAAYIASHRAGAPPPTPL